MEKALKRKYGIALDRRKLNKWLMYMAILTELPIQNFVLYANIPLPIKIMDIINIDIGFIYK